MSAQALRRDESKLGGFLPRNLPGYRRADHIERLEELEILLVTVFHLEGPGVAAALQMKFRLELTDRVG